MLDNFLISLTLSKIETPFAMRRIFQQHIYSTFTFDTTTFLFEVTITFKFSCLVFKFVFVLHRQWFATNIVMNDEITYQNNLNNFSTNTIRRFILSSPCIIFKTTLKCDETSLQNISSDRFVILSRWLSTTR